ncbi:hypothetical protein B0B52_07180 [Polaromonas sp. A23]|nr:hypothetical protein B0B52_07180 [Polaromonas sp. A23]
MELIDSDRREQVDAAKSLLERLLLKDPKFAAAYLELARIAMKTNWGPEGFRQAERLISSTLQLQPGSLNALVLQGYVYSHQGRFKEAETAFREANKPELKNLWLWSNWGEMLVKQGKVDAAIPMYRKAIEHPPTNDTYDRARIDAYDNLLSILGSRKDIDGMEGLHKRRAKEYGVNTCYGADYALFRLMFRGETADAISLAEESIQAGCNEKVANRVLAYAFYTAWGLSKGKERNDLLNRAQVYLPADAGVLYGLSTSEHTLAAVKKLIGIGEPVDQLDNRNMNALAYALDGRDHNAATRLMRLGAKPETTVGNQGIPVALIPLLSKDYEGIRLLRKLGVDYSRIQFQGATAVEIARRIGDPKLVEALNIKESRV